MSQLPKTLYLLDAMALAYRAHFIFISRPLINSKGFNSSATYGFMTALVKLIEDHGMDHIAVVFDVMTEGGTFRDEMYPDYKAHRDPPPEDLIANLPYIKSVVRAMDIPVVEVGGVEADDVIGTLAKRAEREGVDTVIVSPDKDFQQLLSKNVSMFRPAYRGESFDPVTEDSFREKFGLAPVQFIDVLALMGDAADNVPGVHGIGEKTAVKLIAEYNTVENLIEHADDLTGKRAREGMQNDSEMALLSKKLVTIKTDVELDLGWDDFLCKSPDLAEIRSLFDDLEFSQLFERVARVMRSKMGNAGVDPNEEYAPNLAKEATGKDTGMSAARVETVTDSTDGATGTTEQGMLFANDTIASYDEADVDYQFVNSLGALEAAVQELAGASSLSFDTETTSVDPLLASLVGISFSDRAKRAFYIPTPLPDGTPTDTVLEHLRPILESECEKIGQNVKYDWLVLARHGIRVAGPVFDTMVAHYLISPESQHGLDYLSKAYLSYQTIPISSLIGSGKEAITMRDVPPADVSPYACEDADIAFQLSEVFRPMLKEKGVDKLAETVEFPLITVLARMELEGIALDRTVLSKLSIRAGDDLTTLQAQIYESANEEFNIASPAQIGVILFEKLGLRVVAKTSKGKPSTKESVLHELAAEHELPGMILDWRELAKLKSTYLDSLGKLVHPETERLHTSFSQTTAATGRLASSNPNLQNIPIRTERGREVRTAFVAGDGYSLVSADYAQIELRILASLAGDEALKRAYRDGEDIHTATAAKVFDTPPAEVTREQRNKAKEVNYGIPYGISAFGLSTRLRCSASEAQELIDTYKKNYPAVAQFIVESVESARERGFAETMLGRRRYIPDINARNRNIRSFAERVAVNMPIQGSQADMIKLAMIAIDRRLCEEGYASKMLLQVHDELVFAVVEAEKEALIKMISSEMINALPLEVPIEVSIGSGANWLEAH